MKFFVFSQIKCIIIVEVQTYSHIARNRFKRPSRRLPHIRLVTIAPSVPTKATTMNDFTKAPDTAHSTPLAIFSGPIRFLKSSSMTASCLSPQLNPRHTGILVISNHCDSEPGDEQIIMVSFTAKSPWALLHSDSYVVTLASSSKVTSSTLVSISQSNFLNLALALIVCPRLEKGPGCWSPYLTQTNRQLHGHRER
jgi:hypothetical protein